MIEYAIFLHGLAQQWRPRKKTKFGTTVAYARTSNTRIAQRKRAIPHSTLKYDVPYTQR